jgi:hypothetical protein
LTRHPAINSAWVQEQLEVSAPTANGAIEHLAGLGVLSRASGNHRYRRWVAVEVLEALDAFAARAGRRAS